MTTAQSAAPSAAPSSTRHTAQIRAAWNELTPQGPVFAARFYETLFALDPSLKALFKGDMARQRDQLVGMLDSAITWLDEPDSLMPALRSAGRRHAGYGVQEAHYAVVGRALLDTLASMLGERYTPAMRAAWTDTYGLISQVMMEAARPATPAMATAPMLRLPALVVMALVMAGGATPPVVAQEVGWHPATSARPMPATGIDPNTFVVGHPASPTTRAGHAGSEHPAVLVASAAAQRGVDANTFIVQPPTAVTWIATPSSDDTTRFAQGAAQTTAR